MFYDYYCPICGEVQGSKDKWVYCIQCYQYVHLCKAQHDHDYYRQKAIERTGTSEFSPETIDMHQEILIEEEASKNPQYRPEMRFYTPTEEEKKAELERLEKKKFEMMLEEALKKNTATQSHEENKPKCPTCGSTNIERISTTSKIIGAALFDLLSVTARSQFKCKNCGYKW